MDCGGSAASTGALILRHTPRTPTPPDSNAELEARTHDYLLAADVIWVEELIPPLVRTIVQALCQGPGTQLLLAHQTRSQRSDNLFFRLLHLGGMEWERLPTVSLHPEFSPPHISVFVARRAVADAAEAADA